MSCPYNQSVIIYNEWKILLFPNIDSISIQIEKKNTNQIYNNNFKLKFFTNKLNIFTLKDLMDLIKTLILKQNITINEEENIIKLIFYISIKDKIELILYNTKQNIKELKKKKEIKLEDIEIKLISIFPSGNIILTKCDHSIKIYDTNFNVIQILENAHNNCISNLTIIDENNFITCSFDKSIKFWIKLNNLFQTNSIIENAHKDWINKIIYCSNKKLISCSSDHTIKIWIINNNQKYECISILKHNDAIFSILLLEDKNILISSGWDGTIIWNYNNLRILKYIKDTECYFSSESVKRINNDKIICGGSFNGIMKIISISNNEIIKIINNGVRCNIIYVVNEKEIFLTGGYFNIIKVYKCDNYECIKTINMNNNINGIIQLKNDDIAILSYNSIIQIWSFEI